MKASHSIKRGHLWADKKEGRSAQSSLDTTEIKLDRDEFESTSQRDHGLWMPVL